MHRFLRLISFCLHFACLQIRPWASNSGRGRRRWIKMFLSIQNIIKGQLFQIKKGPFDEGNLLQKRLFCWRQGLSGRKYAITIFNPQLSGNCQNFIENKRWKAPFSRKRRTRIWESNEPVLIYCGLEWRHMRKFGVKRSLIYAPPSPKSGHVWDVKKRRAECIKFSLCTLSYIWW